MRHGEGSIVLEHAQAVPAELVHESGPIAREPFHDHRRSLGELESELDEEAMLLDDISPKGGSVRPYQDRLAMGAMGIDEHLAGRGYALQPIVGLVNRLVPVDAPGGAFVFRIVVAPGPTRGAKHSVAPDEIRTEGGVVKAFRLQPPEGMARGARERLVQKDDVVVHTHSWFLLPLSPTFPAELLPGSTRASPWNGHEALQILRFDLVGGRFE
jgi:hypothetical protein